VQIARQVRAILHDELGDSLTHAAASAAIESRTSRIVTDRWRAMERFELTRPSG